MATKAKNGDEVGQTKKIVTDYLNAYKKGDYRKLRSFLADRGRFGMSQMSADNYVKTISQDRPWRNVKVISSVYTGTTAALLYQGTDTENGHLMQASEFFDVSGGKIKSIRGSVIGVAGALADIDGFAAAVMGVAI
jgi:hypothetical protein